LVYNNLLDTDARTPTYFQWISGTANTAVNFANSTFNISLTGTTTAPTFDVYTSRVFSLPGGSTFTATGSGQVNLVNAGGFLGQINAASFRDPSGANIGVNIAGSSVDGAFFGPNGEEVGGGYRIVGGTPDERIDILGAFTGKK
jgi:C-lobe and N-lobe beta barrels of Tf-binding protein B